jgi:regulatory protein
VRPRSRASAADAAPLSEAEAHGLALGWLGARDLSVAQVRQRFGRRGVDRATADRVIERLVASGVLDEARLARAAARQETVIRGRGPARARTRLRSLGVPDDTAARALDQVIADVDVEALLDRALEKRLRGRPAGPLDAAATRRLVGALVRQGFDPGAVLTRLRRRGADVEDVD